jgi:hypothetical protein
MASKQATKPATNNFVEKREGGTGNGREPSPKNVLWNTGQKKIKKCKAVRTQRSGRPEWKLFEVAWPGLAEDQESRESSLSRENWAIEERAMGDLFTCRRLSLPN